jgi:hypothetical protein
VDIADSFGAACYEEVENEGEKLSEKANACHALSETVWEEGYYQAALNSQKPDGTCDSRNRDEIRYP